MGEETINPMSMDPLAFHLALTLTATLCGYKFYDFYKQFLPNVELPVMCLAMIFGVIINMIIGHTRFKDSIDEHGNRLSGWLWCGIYFDFHCT